MSQYDVIVIGGGSPGEHFAAAVAEGGLRVAIVERELLGGECSFWACIPPVVRDLPGRWTNREATGVKEIPGRLLILGGGPVGVEMAQAFQRLGSSRDPDS